MPLVFVHGVYVRKEEDYFAPSEKTRNELFRKISFVNALPAPELAQIASPYWGGDASKFAWDRESLPGIESERFGSASSRLDSLAEQASLELPGAIPNVAEKELLVRAARLSLSEALNLLWTADTYSQSVDANSEETAVIAKAARYAAANPKPAWVFAVTTDEEFIDRFFTEVEDWQEYTSTNGSETFGSGLFGRLVERLKDTARSLATSVVASATKPLVRKVRPGLNDFITRFVGDVFVYLRSREASGEQAPIVKTVATALRQAGARRSPDNPLVIVGHSMGGNIAYDLLTSFCKDVTCDVFLSVGSQVGLFEEMKLYKSSDPRLGKPNKVSRPTNILRWINVFDLADVFSYRLGPIVEGVEDFEYSTKVTVFDAHGAYLLQPGFHQRLAERLKGN